MLVQKPCKLDGDGVAPRPAALSLSPPWLPYVLLLSAALMMSSVALAAPAESVQLPQKAERAEREQDSRAEPKREKDGARRAQRVVWRINFGDRISDAFTAWAKQTRKWQVVWEAPELVAQASVDVEGSFEDAVSKVIEALNRGDAGLLARFYVDSANSVLRVMEKK